MNWRKANREQLVNIAFIDNEAPLQYKSEAVAELKRRNRRRYGRTNIKLKEVYPQ